MSATNRGTERIEHDFYATPQDAILPLLKEIDLSLVESFIEPCAADGAILQYFSHLHDIQTAEIRDGIDYFLEDFKCADLLITNPPFNQAIEFLKKSLTEARTVAYLMRLNILGSKDRKDFWNMNPTTHQFTLSSRPCFVDVCKNKSCKAKYARKDEVKICPDCGGKVGKGSDATEYAWFVWDRGGIFKRRPGNYSI